MKAYNVLREQQEEILQASKLAALGKLAAGLTHEFNSPLSVIVSSCQTLETTLEKCQSQTPDPSIAVALKATAKNIRTGTDRINKAVKALKTFALVDKPAVTEVDVNECISAAILLLKARFPDTIQVETSFPKTLVVRCLGRELNHIILAVLENAFQAVSKNGTISVSTDSCNNDLLIVIRDNGCGIAADILAKIFDPAFSIREGRVKLGLGLCSVKRLLLEMNGDISIQTEVSQGTKVMIRIPLLQNELS
jgi:C4-dicarboxylate-specific signal transduction histidine kinase